MFNILVAIMVAGIWLGGYALGRYATRWMPERRLGEETKTTIRAVIAILITFTALVLSLLTTAAKSSYDVTDARIRTYASQIITLDQLMQSYGPTTAPVRSELRAYVADALAQSWPAEAPPRPIMARLASPKVGAAGNLESTAQGEMLRRIQDQIRALEPQNPVQKAVAEDARAMIRDMMEQRWQIIESDHASIPTPFMVLLIGWLTIIFASFGLSANSEWLVHVTVVLTTLALASVIYCILDLDGGFDGLMAISSTPLRAALTHLSG